MNKAISIILFGTVVLACLLTGCDPTVNDEESTGTNDEIIAAIDKSLPITTGNLITKTDTDKDGNINVKYYDNNDNLVEQYIWNDDNEVSHVLMTYSDRKLLTTKEEISSDGKSNVVYSYQYDSNDNLYQTTVSEFADGFITKATVYDNEDIKTEYSLYFYNETDQLSKIERYDEKDKLQDYCTYEYDTKGYKTKYSEFSADGNIQKYITFKYNDASLLEKEEYFDSSNVLQNYYIYEYYDSGNIKTSSQYDSAGNQITKDYYDDVTK